MKTQTIKDLQFIVAPAPSPPPLPPVPVAVAVARLIGRPVEAAEVVPVPRPERLCWAQFRPVRRPDPFLPVPLVAFSAPLWDRLREWAQHYMRWSRRGDQARWGAAGLEIVADLERFLAGCGELLPAERSWLTDALWRQYAQPQGIPALLAAETELNRQRRQAQRRARAQAWRRREAERVAYCDGWGW